MIVVRINLSEDEKPTWDELQKLRDNFNNTYCSIYKDQYSFPTDTNVSTLVSKNYIIFVPFKQGKFFPFFFDEYNCASSTNDSTPLIIDQLLTQVYVQEVEGIAGALAFLAKPKDEQKQEKGRKIVNLNGSNKSSISSFAIEAEAKVSSMNLFNAGKAAGKANVSESLLDPSNKTSEEAEKQSKSCCFGNCSTM